MSEIERGLVETHDLIASTASSSAATGIALNQISGLSSKWTAEQESVYLNLRNASRHLTALLLEIEVSMATPYLSRVVAEGFTAESLQEALTNGGVNLRVLSARADLAIRSEDICSPNAQVSILPDEIVLRMHATFDAAGDTTAYVVYDIVATGNDIVLFPVRLSRLCPDSAIGDVDWEIARSAMHEVLEKKRVVTLPLSLDVADGVSMSLDGEFVGNAVSIFSKAIGGRHNAMTPVNSVSDPYDLQINIVPVVLRLALIKALASLSAQISEPYNMYVLSLREGPIFSTSAQAIDFRVGLYVHVEGTIDFYVGHQDWGIEVWGSMPVRCQPWLTPDGSTLTLDCDQNGKIDIDSWAFHPGLVNVATEVLDAITGASNQIKDNVNSIDLG